MERRKAPNTNKAPGGNGQATKVQLQTLSQLVARASLAGRLGQQYEGDRDIYQALGYPDIAGLEYKDYMAKYLRQDIAKAIIDRPVSATWQGLLELVDTFNTEDSGLESAWDELERMLGLKTRFARLDKLVGLGQYGILLLGLDDVRSKTGLAEPVRSGNRKLKYVKPFGEGSTTIHKYENNTGNPRYGLPTVYEVELADPGTSSVSPVLVHHSRVIHVIGDSLESEVKGIPRLEPVYNRLMDLEKIVGGDAEMFWRGARPGYVGKVDDQYQMTDTTKTDLQDQIAEYEHNLRRILVNEGVDLTALAQQIADPLNHVQIQLQMISAETGIPQRILTGSERGELASTQDRVEWLGFISARRQEFAEPNIVRPFVDRCIKYGVLPVPTEDKYSMKWTDLWSPSDKERVEIARLRASALKDYYSNPMVEFIVPPEAFLRYFLGLSEEDVKIIDDMRRQGVTDEDALLSRIEGETDDSDV